MLKLLRKYSRSWFIIVAVGLIVVVFIFWGIGGFKSSRYQEVAEVNGDSIFFPDYFRQYNDLLRQYQEQFKGELTEDLLKQLRLKEQALSRLVDQTLLQQAARRLGLQVSNAELQEAIRSLPYFQEDGHFSEKRYYLLLSRSRLNPADFEAQERRRLLTQKLVREVTSFAKVSDGDLKEFFKLSREEVEVNYLVVSPELFLAKQNPREDQVAAYYQEHQAEFRHPERVRVRYLLFRPADYLAKVTVTPKELQDYLKEHAEEFVRAKVIRAREVFLALPPKSPPAEKSRLEKQARDLQRQAQAGQDFTRLAHTFSQDEAGRKSGGDLGSLKRGENLPEWEKTAFALGAGDVGVAQTKRGFHVIKVDEVKETEPLPEAEAKALADRTLKESKSRLLAQEAANQARSDISGSSLLEVAKKHGWIPHETPLFALADPLASLGGLRLFQQAALALKPGEVGKIVELPQGLVVMQGLERQPASQPTLEQVKDRVRQAVSRRQARDQAAREAEQLLKRLQQGETLSHVAAKAGVTVQDSGFFTRGQGFKNQPQAEALTSAAFLLSKAKPYPAKPISWQDKNYLLAFKARRAPSAEDFQKEEANLRAQLFEQKKQLLFDSWLAGERQRAKIKVFELPS